MEKITEFRGVKDLVFAKLIKDEKDELTYGDVKELAGIAEISKEVETSSETHYYDNKPAVTIEANGKDTITIQASALDLKTLAEITGQHYDETKKMLVEGERKNDYFAIGYVTEKTDGTEMYVWRLKGTFGIPNENSKTKDDGTEATGQELVYTGISTTHQFKATGKGAKSICIEGKDAAGDKFFGEVQTPDSELPAV